MGGSSSMGLLSSNQIQNTAKENNQLDSRENFNKYFL